MDKQEIDQIIKQQMKADPRYLTHVPSKPIPAGASSAVSRPSLDSGVSPAVVEPIDDELQRQRQQVAEAVAAALGNRSHLAHRRLVDRTI